MGKRYLLDSNVIIDFSAQKLPAKADKKISFIINSSPRISIINKIELLSLPKVSHQIAAFAEQALVISLDDDIVNKTIDLRRQHKIKIPDAVIAATALVFDLTLITHNIVDFKNVKGLKMIDSYLFA